MGAIRSVQSELQDINEAIKTLKPKRELYVSVCHNVCKLKLKQGKGAKVIDCFSEVHVMAGILRQLNSVLTGVLTKEKTE